jgi:hypothetical protein
MGSPALLVVTLLILWLIVLVPMIFRRVDDGAPARSMRRYGQSMRLLNRRHARGPKYLNETAEAGYPVSYVAPRITAARDEVFVPGARGRTAVAVAVEGGRRLTSAGREGQMYRAEMSDARRQMLARRRRSLTILIGGSAMSLLLAFLVGGTLLALAATAFCIGLAGYVFFLRSQALRDRERHSLRSERALDRSHVEEHLHDRYEERYDERYEEEFEQPPVTMVRIDDDNIELHNLDTIDLTGVYNEAEFVSDQRQRRAS